MTSRNIFFGTTAQGKISYDTVSGNFTLGNSNTDLIHMNSNTNMGVGFTAIQTPTYRLDVSGGDINTNGVYRINGVEVLAEGTLGSGITSIGPIDSLIINNDLTVNGTTTTINTETLTIEDPLIKLASQNTADIVDTGFYGLYNDGVSKFSGLYRDADDGVFKFFTGTTVEPTTTIDNASANGYILADVEISTLVGATGIITNDFTVNTDTFIVDTNVDRVGINKGVPTEALDVVGNIGVSGNILSTLDDTFDLGTTTIRFRDLFLGPGTLHIGDGRISSTGTQLNITNSMTVNTDLNVGGALCVTGAIELGDNLTLAGTLNVTGVGTFETDLVIADDLTVDTNTLVVDSSTNRVGVGLTNPSTPFDVVGDINTSTDYNIGGAQVLSSTTLGNAVVNSSLTSVGELTDLTVVGDIGTSGVYNIDDTQVLSATTLGSGIINASLTSNTGNLTNTGTMNVTTGNDYQINTVSVLNATTLGSAVVVSSLTSVGDLTNLTVVGDLTVDTNTLYVDSGGNNVAIGTTNPISKLDIVADTANDGDETAAHGLRIQTGTSGHSLMMGYDGTDDISYINSGNTDGNTDIAIQTRGGFVGIGTTIPTVPLEIVGNASRLLTLDSSNATQNGINIRNSTNDDQWQLRFDSVSTGTTGQFRINHRNPSLDFWAGFLLERTGTGTGQLQLGNFVDDSCDLIVDGQIGVGTTSPSSVTPWNTGVSLGGHVQAFHGERNGTATATTIYAYGNGSTVAFGPCMPFAGTVIHLSVSSSASATATITLRKNNIDTTDTVALAASLAANATASETFVANDALSMAITSGSLDNSIATFWVLFD